MTQRDAWTLVALVLAPTATAVVGHALRLGGSMLAAIVCVVGVACTVAGTAIGWRSR